MSRPSQIAALVVALALSAAPALAIDVGAGGPLSAAVTVGSADQSVATYVPSDCGCLPPGLRLTTANGSPTDVTAEEMAGKTVTTTDGVRVGTVHRITEGSGGVPLAVVDLEAGLVPDVTRIAIQLGSARLVAGRNLRLETDAADLTVSIAAALAPAPAA